jgi:potassium-dependent mechanosensitive channel
MSLRSCASAGFAGVMLAVASTARAQVAVNDRLSILDALRHDGGAGAALVRQQWGMGFTSAFGLPLLLALLALALALAWPVRLWVLARYAALLRSPPLDTALIITARAVGAVVITTMVVALAGQIALAAVDWTVVLLPATQALAHTMGVSVGVAGFGLGIGRALRSADDKTLRPVPLPPGMGQTIAFYPFAAGAMLGAIHVIDRFAGIVHATQTGWNLAQGLIALVEIAMIAHFLVLVGEARQRQTDGPRTNGAQADAPHTDSRGVPAVFGMTAVVWAALAVAGVALLFGNIRLPMHILQELLWAGLVLIAAWLLTGFVEALTTQFFDAERRIGRFATAVMGLRRAQLQQIVLLVSAMLTVAVWVFAIGLVAAPLHDDHAVVIDQVQPGALLVSAQSLKLSPHTIGMALFVLFVGVALTRMVRGWLEKRFLPATSLDIGVRTSLVTGLSYIGIIVALLSATTVLGLQLEKITLIASALSVGIGFGLQSIIQNFVSGVILLIERPVKQGDWVAVSGVEGTIRRIRVRATELVTADGGTAIVPNSSFISTNVANRADTLAPFQVDVALTVSGCASAAEARDAILAMLKTCAVMRETPKPRLLLATLGEADWAFVLKVYAKPGTSVAQAKSELLFWLSEHAQGQDIKIKST